MEPQGCESPQQDSDEEHRVFWLEISMAALWSLVVSLSVWRSLWFWGNLKKKSGSCNWWTGILGGRLRWEKWSYWGIRYPKLSTREPFEVSVDIFSSSCILEGFVWLVSRFAVLNSSDFTGYEQCNFVIEYSMPCRTIPTLSSSMKLLRRDCNRRTDCPSVTYWWRWREHPQVLTSMLCLLSL